MKLTCDLLGDASPVSIEFSDGRTMKFHTIPEFYEFLDRMSKVRKLMAEMQDQNESQQSNS
jgi:hypothetical protein